MKNLVQYQWEEFINQKKPIKNIKSKIFNFGYSIISRNSNKSIKEVEFKIYLDNPNLEIYLIGDFNNWNDNLEEIQEFRLKIDGDGFGKVNVKNIKHKQRYKYLVIEDFELKYFQDPAGIYFDDEGNSIFWDFEDKTTYKQKYGFINTIKRSTKILQTDLPGLIVHYKSKLNGKFGHEISNKKYYNFITKSGIIDEIKSLGFNTIQFLPFSQSIDGDNWKLRYLVPFQFAIQKNWGNPDEFSEMIDEFHKAGIAVIGDFVIGHIPFKDYKIFGEDSKNNGLQVWKRKNGNYTYLKEETSWGTIRPDFDNKFVRDFFISSCIFFMKNYKIDGFRIDNVDGILRYGDNGEGNEREKGRNFLRQLNKEIYSYNQYALIHFEAHYFFEDNAKMLVVPFKIDNRALGATAYNESRLTYYFHKDYMLKSAEKISVWKFKYMIDEKEWGQSNSTIADFHNHDAAAGLMEMRCTGSYAYDAMTTKRPENHFHAVGKIKVMEAIISFLQEGRTLDLLQTHLLQKGTFEHDSSIQWNLKEEFESKKVLNFKKDVNYLMDNSAFWPINVKNRKFLNLDEKNKIIVIQRSSKKDNFVIVINISSFEIYDYKIPILNKNNYKLVLNSENKDLNKIFNNKNSNNFELIDREIKIDKVSSYGVYIFKEIKN